MIISGKKQKALIRQSGHVLAMVLEEILTLIRPGVSTGELDSFAYDAIRKAGGDAIFKGYGATKKKAGFPGTICASLNDEVVHGIPSFQRIIQNGDLVKIDIGVRYKGYVTDMARTVCVGDVTDEARKITKITQQALVEGINSIRAKGTLHDYSKAVQEYAEKNGFSVVRDLVGHGVGRELHEEPQIPNYVDQLAFNFIWRDGMVVALEPMVNSGTWKVRMNEDGWTIQTLDKRLSAHFEDTVLVTKDGAEVITKI